MQYIFLKEEYNICATRFKWRMSKHLQGLIMLIIIIIIIIIIIPPNILNT